MKLAGSTKIAAMGLNGAFEANGVVHHGIHRFGLNDSVRDNRSIHFKTNVPKGGNHMVMVEAVGYNYASGQPIRCSWCWYSWAGDGVLYSVGLHNVYNGLVPASVYYSTDNFICFNTVARDTYFIGVVLNAYLTSASHGQGFDIQITNSIATTASGNYY